MSIVEEKASLEDRLVDLELQLHDYQLRAREEWENTRRSLDVSIQTLSAVFVEA